MAENKTSEGKQVFISYKEDNDNLVSGYVVLIEQTATYIKFQTGKNIITLPISRLIKLKEKI